MHQISINLLPVELAVVKKQQERKTLVVKISTIILAATVLLTALVLVLGITQNFNIDRLETQIKSSREKITQHKDREGLAYVLRKRIDAISGISKTDTTHALTLNLITNLLPADVKMLNFNNNKKGQMLFSGETNSSRSLQTFFDNLNNPSSHEGRILGTRIESLTLAGGSNIKFDLTILLRND